MSLKIFCILQKFVITTAFWKRASKNIAQMAGYKGNVYTNDMGSQELYEIPVAKTVTDKVAKKPEGSSENGKLNLAK